MYAARHIFLGPKPFTPPDPISHSEVGSWHFWLRVSASPPILPSMERRTQQTRPKTPSRLSVLQRIAASRQATFLANADSMPPEELAAARAEFNAVSSAIGLINAVGRMKQTDAVSRDWTQLPKATRDALYMHATIIKGEGGTDG